MANEPGALILIRVWLTAILALWSGLALAEPGAVPLQLAPAINLVGPPPPVAAAEVKPAFKDKIFPLKEAINLKEIYELVGQLSPAQENFLEKNRFLLLAKPSFLVVPSEPGERPPADEMLANFDRLGGALAPALSAPQNARFVGPDIILHAWNKYLETRVALAEAGPLRENLSGFLAGLYENAAALRAEAGPPASANWERLMAQLAVALILAETGGEAPGDPQAYSQADARGKALANFERYRPAFSEAMARKIRTELGRIYQGEGIEPSQLGLAPAGGEPLVDYAWFTPPAGSPAAPSWRAYFRAQVWLGRLGWDSRTETGLADALNWALAMSRSRPAGAAAEAVVADLPAAWARLTAIISFLSGYADFLSYREWLPFLMKEAGVSEFTADTSSDREVLARLKAAGAWPPVSGPFRELRPTISRGVVCLLPFRHTLPELIEAGLISNDNRPELYSGLWPPVLLGHEGARSLVDRQVSLSRPQASGADKISDPLAATALSARLAHLSEHLRAEPESAWFTSLLAEEWHLLASLSVPGGVGYPLYLQSPAYPAKNLETLTGLLTEAGRRVTGPLPEEATQFPEIAPQAQSHNQGKATDPLVVRGLIEPNPAFWREMVRTVAHTTFVFREYGLFPDDVADNGALHRFLRRLERCAELAERELAGVALTDDDYEFIRLFTLDWLAQPPGDRGGFRPDDQLRSGLVTEAQVIPPQGDQPGLVLYQATAEPWLMLVMTANDLTPRLTLGLAYSHYEFAGPYGRRLTDDIWREAAYGRYQNQPAGIQPALPARNFWYDPLRP